MNKRLNKFSDLYIQFITDYYKEFRHMFEIFMLTWNYNSSLNTTNQTMQLTNDFPSGNGQKKISRSLELSN